MPRRKRRRSPGRFLLRWFLLVTVTASLLSLALVLPWRWINPPATAFMLQDSSGRVPVAYDWQDWSALGSAAALAVVAAEDQKFADHRGIDFASLRDSLTDFSRGDSLRGASTITQQVAKNMYLWPGRSFLRKALEAWLAMWIELTWPKQRILEIYLNVAEFGPGTYGVPAASRLHFGKPPATLSDREAALLASVLPNPSLFDASQPTPYLRERQAWILGHMQRLRRENWLSRLQ